jgi:hypothetical protein
MKMGIFDFLFLVRGKHHSLTFEFGAHIVLRVPKYVKTL